MKYTLLENGLDFILSSLNKLLEYEEKHLNDHEKARVMKYSLIHLSSGMELIFKYILLQEHWIYVFQDMNQADEDKFKSGDFKSVNSKTSLERLEKFCNIDLDQKQKKSIETLRKIRNQVEHYEVQNEIRYIESMTNQNISIVIEIISSKYDIKDFSDSEINLFDKIKENLRILSKHFEEAINLAKVKIKSLELSEFIVHCPSCSEECYIRNENMCYLCDYEGTSEETAKHYIENVLGIDEYTSVKDGGEFPQYSCPECGEYAYVSDSDLCFSCEYQPEGITDFCNWCKEVIDSEKEISMCSSCIERVMSKD